MTSKPRAALCLAAVCMWPAAFSARAQETTKKTAKDALVWAIDDTDKVHPVSGNLLSEGAAVYEGKSPSSGSYR
jgi:hypothetical protein